MNQRLARLADNFDVPFQAGRKCVELALKPTS